MTVICSRCGRDPVDNDDYFYECRFTPTGKDHGELLLDGILCIECLKVELEEKGLEKFQSASRLENPKAEATR